MLLFQSSEPALDLSWARDRFETVESITSLKEVDLSEWDLIITDEDLTPAVSTSSARRSIPGRMYSFRVVNVVQTGSFVVDGVEGDVGLISKTKGVNWRINIPGRQAKRVEGLPESLQDVVQSALVPAINAREMQDGISKFDPQSLLPTITEFRPFLVGPSDLIFAASYKRTGGGRHWIVPSDAGDLGIWLDLAIAEWHTLDPTTFPTGSNWQEAPTWMTVDEAEIHSEITSTTEAFSRAQTIHELRINELETDLERAHVSAIHGRRQLLTGQDDDLQDAVLAALRDLGFEVEDMDDHWPDGARREDYRIRDPEAENWLALGDATGTAKGAKGSKFTSLQTHLTLFLLDERPLDRPFLWLLVNQLRFRDPETRGTLFRDDEAAAIAEANGLAIDTVALFLLSGLAERLPAVKLELRAWMRSRVGQLTIEDARDWIQALPPGQ